MMIAHFAAEASKFGLTLHYGKTKILTWNALVKPSAQVFINGNAVAVLDEAVAEKYLRRELCFQNSQQAELDHRIAASWAVFHKHKNELCSKSYPLRDRLRLFEATVTPTLLYGSSTWALTMQQEASLVVLRRRMLRFVCRIYCRKDDAGEQEDWIDYMSRSAHTVDRISEEHQYESWVLAHRCRKWRFAGRTPCRTENRWSTKLLTWIPNLGHGRLPGRPKTRWSNDIESYVGGNFCEVAVDIRLWSLLEHGFTHGSWRS